MISYIKDKMSMAAEFISIMNKQQFEEPKPPYQKRFMDATHHLFELARNIRKINVELSQLDKNKNIPLESLDSLSYRFYDLNFASFEPFDILLEEAKAELGLNQFTGVLSLLVIEMKAFIDEYKAHKEWYDMQCSFEYQFSVFAKDAHASGIKEIEKMMTELPAARLELAITKQLKSVYAHFDKYPTEHNERKEAYVTENLIEFTGYQLGPSVKDLVLERHENASNRLSNLEFKLTCAINTCFPRMDKSRVEFKDLAFGLFAKLYDKLNEYLLLANRHNYSCSDEVQSDNKLYFIGILDALYHKCNGVVFEGTRMRDYLEVLNLSSAKYGLRIRENKIGHACALIYALYSSSSEDKGYLAGWESKIVTQLGIDPATYKQRKSDIKNGQASGSVMDFYDSIVEMLA